ncbi:phosphoribosylanthranilate isomerase [Massilia sp. Dwa41.01b]|uniref:phosphoribosylanthranilate isomerase n=1 Tax=unclassified Massilia TaxID=2609279 RepID=UPI0016030DF8|nr:MULTISPECIES: phosphoribosylanthranilate isomerase [unclassified Massilia]QNA89890.1 phosphoribosylanthranilate isomerase [Massilia sp. Dwa41.01b]QNB00776.1 phosphoribosylanthranilate isomerase [Massilia sp. Se16.2.3]
MLQRTRIKICGITREEDLRAAVACGADALGFVFYPQSPRYLDPAAFAVLGAHLPPYVSAVALFVNATLEEVRAVVDAAPVALLQFHGDETIAECATIAAAVKRPFVRAFRVEPDTTPLELLECELAYRAASPWFSSLLLDTHVASYGGAGKVFDWSVIPKELAPRVVLSGGLSVQNATEAVTSVRPYAVDISSGVEAGKGIKDARKIAAFVAAVRAGDATIDSEHPHDTRPFSHPRPGA